jgi:uncharacterized protein YjiS (DUF1127 family)
MEIDNMFKRLFKGIQNSRQESANIWLLNNMSDRDLRDIGITRGDIENKVKGK